jgi:hypothetical protein
VLSAISESKHATTCNWHRDAWSRITDLCRTARRKPRLVFQACNEPRERTGSREMDMATLPPLISDELRTTTRSVRKRLDLAAYVQEHVPKLADGSEVRAAFAKRSEGDTDYQSARFDTTGGGFRSGQSLAIGHRTATREFVSFAQPVHGACCGAHVGNWHFASRARRVMSASI